MKVVISLSKRNQGGDNVIPRGVAVIEGLVSQPVGQGVHAKGGLLDKKYAEDARIDEASPPVSPTQASHQHGDDKTHDQNHFEVVAMLQHDDGVLVQIGDVGPANAFRVLLHDHPANMGIEQALAN